MNGCFSDYVALHINNYYKIFELKYVANLQILLRGILTTIGSHLLIQNLAFERRISGASKRTRTSTISLTLNIFSGMQYYSAHKSTKKMIM